MRRTAVLVVPAGIAATGFTGFLIWFLITRLEGELVLTLQVILGAIALAGVVIALGFAVFGIGILREGFYRSTERSKQAELDTRLKRLATEEYQVKILKESKLVTIGGAGDQIYLTDLLQNLTTALHLQPGPVNGIRIEPTDLEVENWRISQLAHGKHAPALPSPDQPAQLGAGELPALPAEVHLRDYLFQCSLSSVFLGVGRLPGEVNPRPIIAPLERLVHIATAGSSGFGKSTFMQALAYQALNAPDSRPVLMDAQGVTFSAFERHPALLARLASDEADILDTLDYLLDEMQRRKGLFSHHPGVAKLRDYNSQVDEPLPAIPAFFDELGLMGDNRDVVTKVKLLVMGGRKFGLFLILGSQTWLASQFSTALRSNLSTSVQFAARDKNQSRVLLSSPEAANITQPGRAYAILPGQAGLVELQAPMVDEADLRAPAQVVTLPDPATARAQALRNSGASLSAIAREVFRLDREPNGRELRRVKLLLGMPE